MSPCDRLLTLYHDVAALKAAQNLLGWDQQVVMPAGGAPARAAHQQLLGRMIHERLTSDEMWRAMEVVLESSEPDSDEGRGAAALKRQLEVDRKWPLALVERKAKISSEAYEVWKVAKAENDFPKLAPYYKELFEIAHETAEAIGYGDHPYDALIGLYEYGATYADARQMFESIKKPIVELVKEIAERGSTNDDHALCGEWDSETLRSFAQNTAAVIGFDFDRGRLNVAPNAFCSNMGCTDVRMTTRASDHLKGIVSSSLHEMGHGLYEQGSPFEWDRKPLEGGVSLAVHESQSRFWENVVGRSQGFWNYFLPHLKSAFPSRPGLEALTSNQMYRAINKVEPTFVRVGADELTYNLHILVRFEIEVELITGSLSIEDLPEAWNQKYRDYLGISPPNDTLGCLQDVHWCRGSVGYFPTYAMGNLIGLQIWERLTVDLPDSESEISTGNFSGILSWLQEEVYRQGCRFTPRELVTRITGKPMQPDAWLRYATKKYRAIYDL